MKFFGVVLSSVFLASSALAWDAGGHQVVVQIAMDHCKPGSAAKVKALMAGATWTTTNTHGTQLFRDYSNPVVAARLADDIVDAIWKHNPFEQDSENYKEYHYLNEELNGDIVHEHGDGDVVKAINGALRKIAGQSTDLFPQGKMEAMSYLLHFVGDAHQPLHCIDDHDTGGHFKFTLPDTNGKTDVCHAWWDTTAKRIYKIKAAMATQSPTEMSTSLDTIESCATKLYKKYKKDIKAAEIKDLAPEHWATESYTFAHDKIYGITDKTQPSSDDIDGWNETAQRRMTLAGLRLAKIFDTYAGDL